MSSTPWSGPRLSIEELCTSYGSAVVADACVRLLTGREVSPTIVVGLGGPPARWAVTGEVPGPAYWLRVWALRGLLWNWDDIATPVVVEALADEAWRAREMAAKVVAKHRVDEALESLIRLRDDPVERVRRAAARATERLTRTTA